MVYECHRVVQRRHMVLHREAKSSIQEDTWCYTGDKGWHIAYTGAYRVVPRGRVWCTRGTDWYIGGTRWYIGNIGWYLEDPGWYMGTYGGTVWYTVGHRVVHSELGGSIPALRKRYLLLRHSYISVDMQPAVG